MEDKKSRFGKIRWWQWVLLFIAVPIVMWVLMLIPTIPIDNLINETHWLSFFGGYIGACITGLITLYVLRLTSLYNTKNLKLTLRQNQANHKELVKLQNTTNNENERLNRENREQNETLNRRQLKLQIDIVEHNILKERYNKIELLCIENYEIIAGYFLTLHEFSFCVDKEKYSPMPEIFTLTLRVLSNIGAKNDIVLNILDKRHEGKYNEYMGGIISKYEKYTTEMMTLLAHLSLLKDFSYDKVLDEMRKDRVEVNILGATVSVKNAIEEQILSHEINGIETFNSVLEIVSTDYKLI